MALNKLYSILKEFFVNERYKINLGILTTDCNFNENGIKNISKTFKAKQVKSNLQESDYMYLEENDLPHNSEFKLKDNFMFKFDIPGGGCRFN